MFTQRVTEVSALVGTIQSISGVGSYYTDAIALYADTGRRFLFEINTGTPATNGTVDFEVQWSATATGTYATVTGTAITQDLVGGATHVVEVSTEQVLALNPTATYLKGYAKTLVASTPIGVTVRGFEGAHYPMVDQAAHVGQKKVAVS